MRILFASQRVPFPPNKGDKLRSFNEIVHLSKNHEIDLFCLSDNGNDLQYKSELKKFCRSVTIVRETPLASNIRAGAALLGRGSFTRAYFRSPRLQAAITAALATGAYQAVFVYCSSMASYFETGCNVPRIIDFVDVDSEKWRQYAATAPVPKNLIFSLEHHRLKKYEKALAETCRHAFFVSEHEVRDFKKTICDSDNITALHNGVDTTRFYPAQNPYDNNRIIFTGAMDYFANVATVGYFVDEILPHIASQAPDAHFCIVGSNPPPAVKKLKDSGFAVTVTGTVENILPYLHRAAVFAAPMQIARGVQNKILEAMASGVPVVTNTRGFEGINAVKGTDLVVEDDPRAFALACLRIMQNPGIRDTFSKNGLRVIRTSYQWDTNLAHLDEVLQELAVP
jgi:sugar transferase (PEP-CTERM/EpsH1 system associated)